MPQVIEAGKLYAAIPPLYSVGRGSKIIYFTTKLEFAKYTQQQFIKLHTVSHLKKSLKKFTNSEYIKFFYQNADYAYNLDILKDIFAVDVGLLELVLYMIADSIDFETEREIAVASFAKAATVEDAEDVKNFVNSSIVQSVKYSLVGLNYSKFKSAIEKAYRFVKVEKRNGTILIQGEVNNLYQYIFLNDYFIRNCIDMINLIRANSEKYFDMDGSRVSIYSIIKTFDDIMPNVNRYKGLGEMNESELAESTLKPENRTLIRYTMESVKEEINNIRYVDSNFANLLNDITITRQDVE